MNKPPQQAGHAKDAIARFTGNSRVNGPLRWVFGQEEIAVMRLTVSVKGRAVIFHSPYTDDEVLRVLRGLMARGQIMSSFADDLVRKAEGGRKLSRSQLNWVHKLVSDAERRAQTRTVGEVTGQTRKPGSHR